MQQPSSQICLVQLICFCLCRMVSAPSLRRRIQLLYNLVLWLSFLDVQVSRIKPGERSLSNMRHRKTIQKPSQSASIRQKGRMAPPKDCKSATMRYHIHKEECIGAQKTANRRQCTIKHEGKNNYEESGKWQPQNPTVLSGLSKNKQWHQARQPPPA